MNVVPASPYMIPWLADRAGVNVSQNVKAIAAVDARGTIHGMVGFDGWTGNSVVMSVALDNPASLRSLIRPAFDYAFNQANRGVALATVKGSNKRSLRLCNRVGLREVYRVRDGVAVGEDLVIFEMRREDCRWINQRRAA